MSDLIPHILVADDDPALRESLRLSLNKQYHVSEAKSVEMAKAVLRQKDFDAAIVDLCFEGQDQDGVNLIDFMLKETPKIPIIILSGDSSTKRVVDATKRNHVDFVVKGQDFYKQLDLALQRAIQRRTTNNQPKLSFLTKSPKVEDVLLAVDRVLRSPSQAPILIYGETGTGKEHLAKYIAEKLSQKVVTANMASIPKETAESELFGHERGAFTGAVANRIGLIEQAHNGIFFLDELGECSPSLQAKLLRVIQEKEIQPLGSNRTKKISVRFIAATHRNIEQMVRTGDFREDLFQRLNTFTVKIPALRDRPQDILYYADMFLVEIAKAHKYSISPCGADALLSHPWPGNTRELKNVIHRIVALSNKRVVDGETVKWALKSIVNREPEVQDEKQLAFASRRAALIEALNKACGNRSDAARILGIEPRTVFRWIEKYGLTDFVIGKPGRPLGSYKVGGQT